MDMNTISAALASLSLTANFVKKSIEKIKDDAVREKVQELLDTIIPLQSFVISLQTTVSTVNKEKEALEQKLREIENWRQEASSYELTQIASGVYTYTKKKTIESSEPVHYLCAKCYNDQRKSILQRVNKTMAGVKYICHTCKSEFLDHSQSSPSTYENPNWDAFT